MAAETVQRAQEAAERQELARHAATHIEALCLMLQREQARASDDFDLVLSSTLLRLKDLSGVVMTAMGDNVATCEEMSATLYGREARGARLV